MLSLPCRVILTLAAYSPAPLDYNHYSFKGWRSRPDGGEGDFYKLAEVVSTLRAPYPWQSIGCALMVYHRHRFIDIKDTRDGIEIHRGQDKDLGQAWGQKSTEGAGQKVIAAKRIPPVFQSFSLPGSVSSPPKYYCPFTVLISIILIAISYI